MPTAARHNPLVKPVFVKTFGCKVNYAESGAFGDLLRRAGYTPLDVHGSQLPFPEEVERPVVFVNSCCVTLEAERKAAQFVRGVKRRYPQACVLLTGCAARNHTVREQYSSAGAEVFDFYPQAFDWLMEHVKPVAATFHPPENAADRNDSQAGLPTGVVTPSRVRAFIKVQDGCHNCCSFCIIPFVRPYASRPIAEIIEEAERKLSEGQCELVLTGVNIGHYGLTPVASVNEVASDKLWGRGKLYTAIPNHPNLFDLIDALLAMLGPRQRLRISSIEPEDLTERFFEQLKHPRMCPHLHLPLQSGSNKVLADMRRLYTASEYLHIAERFRSACPGGSLTTDIMTGYPSEGQAEFAETLELVSTARFEKVHAFPFSPRPGTRAGRLPQLPRAEVRDRNRRLIAHAQAVADVQWQSRVGRIVDVLLENYDAERGAWTGHAPAFEEVSLTADPEAFMPGEMVKLRLASHMGAGLFTAT